MSLDHPSQREIANRILQIEHKNFAVKLGLINSDIEKIDRPLLMKAIALIDNLSKIEDEFAKRLAVMVVALSWEHSDPSYKESLREIFTLLLSRMGISPSTMLIDKGFKDEGVISKFSSYINELAVFAYHLNCEISFNNRTYLLTAFQKKIWDSISSNRIVCISAPTSAGKSHVIYLKLAKMFLDGANSALYIVPTISLLNQVTKDISKLLREHGLKDINIYNGYQPSIGKRSVYVLTQERAMGAFNFPRAFEGLNLLVVDEIQNIEKVADEDDYRSKVLYDLLKEIKHDVAPSKIVLCGPRLVNLENLGYEIFDEVSEKAETKVPPVVNLTYSISKIKKDYFFSQYCDIQENPVRMKIENYSLIDGIGGSKYTDSFHKYLFSIVSKLQTNEGNLIFSPNPYQARNTAKFLADNIPQKEDGFLIGLSSYIKNFVHEDYDLSSIVKHGVAYHTGSLPFHIRSAIEFAFYNGYIKNVVCTTTLMQGVNFPASNIIIRNPNLFLKRNKAHTPPKLSGYEFSNLRGRAGRLLKDFTGRTIVLDETAFFIDEAEESIIFTDAEKELKPGYGESFDKCKEKIQDSIENQIPISQLGPEELTKQLLINIRQTLLRHGLAGAQRLRETKINLEEKFIYETLEALEHLEAPKHVMLKNRYWDPFDIEELYQALQRGYINPIPNNVWEPNLDGILSDAVNMIRTFLPTYFNRHLNSSLNIWSVCKYAEQWAREEMLVEILTRRFPYGKEGVNLELDRAIKMIMNYSSYGLPMLLKPLGELSNEDNSVLLSIELGAYHPTTKFLINKGVPRDTAIYLRRNFLQDFERVTDIEPERLVSNLQRNKDRLDVWTQSQVEALIG